MFTIGLTGDQAVIARFTAMPAKLQSALYKKITILSLLIERKVKMQKLSGQVLNVRTGRLRRSIFRRVAMEIGRVMGIVGSSGDVPYAGIHEFGGQTKAHVIEAKKADVLAFMQNGKMVFRKRVNHPGSKMPERSFLRSTLGEERTTITTGLKQAVVEGLGK